jgi:polyphenol oxidase
MNKLILKKEKGFYRIPLLEEFGVRALFTSRTYDMGFEGGSRNKAYPNLGINWRNLVGISQVHGCNVVKVDKRHRGKGVLRRSTAIQDTDAVFTDAKGLPIAILTADCLPLFLFDTKKRIGALAHAGWRGVQQNIIPKTLKKMRENFKTDVSDVVSVFGPAIGSCCYEVGKEFLKYFPGKLKRRQGKLYFSLAEEAFLQLKDSGVKSRNIYDTGICTSCMNHEFFSYRREDKSSGRSMSVLEIL